MLGAIGLALLAVRHPAALSVSLAALGVAAAVALDQGAPAAAAPLWGAGLLVAGALAERALTLPGDGEIEAEALIGWLAGLGALAGVGLAAGALVLLAGDDERRHDGRGPRRGRGAGRRAGGARAPPQRPGRSRVRVDRRELAAIFAGGFIGALARLGLVEVLPPRPASGRGRPSSSTSSARCPGYFTTRLQERLPLSAYRRPFLGTGCAAR